MKLPLSNRLLACCSFINPGDRVADIGCDHGYLGIHLLQNQIASHVIAADVNEMPLQSAIHNAARYGVRDRMQFYLSDGLRSIPKDFDCMVCAGMGADTMISIIGSALWLRNGQHRMILQCQSRRPELRRWLNSQGFAILRETLAQDGKFIYPVMEVIYRPGQKLTPGGIHISPALLASGSPLLPDFYERVRAGLHTTVEGLSRTPDNPRLAEYRTALEELNAMEAQVYGKCC